MAKITHDGLIRMLKKNKLSYKVNSDTFFDWVYITSKTGSICYFKFSKDGSFVDTDIANLFG
jgi:hypothetical protein